MSEEINWAQKSFQSSVGPHPDYKINLNRAKNLITPYQEDIIAKVRVYIASSQHLLESILMICWVPPLYAKIGKYATAISLHQKSSEFNVMSTKVINTYNSFSRNYLESRQINLRF